MLRWRPPHWRDLPRYPARTSISSHAARQAADLARIICAGSSAQISVFLSPYTPPKIVCCDDRLNPPFKAEVIHRRGPWRHAEAVEFATLEWVDWFNHRRILEPIGNVPPAESEARYYAQLETMPIAA